MKKYEEIYQAYAESMGPEGELGEMVTQALHGGKNIRAILVLAWCDYYGGDINKALPAAFAVELAHCASLIQDDLPCMDNSTMRRGKPALHKTFGEAGAILCSDVLLSLSYAFLASLDIPMECRLGAIRLFSETFIDMCDGQYAELSSSVIKPDLQIDINLKKTGALMGCACSLGAIVAGKDYTEAQMFGQHLGLAYQILDDKKDRDGAYKTLTDREMEIVLKICQNNLTLSGNSVAANFLTSLTKQFTL